MIDFKTVLTIMKKFGQAKVIQDMNIRYNNVLDLIVNSRQFILN